MKWLLPIILVLSHCLSASGQLNARFTADKTGGCGPLVVHFTNETAGAVGQGGAGGQGGAVGQGSAASYLWDLGDGNTAASENAVAIYTQPGNYTVTLTVRLGSQSSTASQVVTVYRAPTADFVVSATKVCSPTPIQFTSTSTPANGAIASYLWDFGDGSTMSGPSASLSHAYQAAGIEGVSLTVTDIYGCTATKVDSALLTILPRMQAAFSEDNRVLCTVGSPVRFTNGSSGPGTLSYTWSFGDGGTSTQVSPSYTYGTKGTYTVVLTATSSAGCMASDTQANVLNVANFNPGFVLPALTCQNAVVTFGDQSAPVPNAQTWMIDGSLAATPAFGPMTWIFSTPGAHTVTQTDQWGACRLSATQTVNVPAAPVVAPFDMVPQGLCGAPESVTFTDHTPGAVRWGWLFNYSGYTPYGQDTVFGGPVKSSLYGENQYYDVQLTVTNTAGCTASAVQLLGIQAPYYRAYETDDNSDRSCNAAITKSYAIESPAQLTSFEWNFGDGTTSTALTPTHTWTTPGYYSVTLFWTDKNGCTGSFGLPQIIIAPDFVVTFAPNDTTVCAGQVVPFTAPGYIYSNSLYLTYDFGDGSEWLGSYYANHSYSTPGVYTVTLKSTDFSGCYRQATGTVHVVGASIVSLSATNSCAGSRGDVRFNVQSAGADSLLWDFGDGQSQITDSTVTQLLHTYNATGYYSASVTAITGACSSMAQRQVQVLLKPSSVQLYESGFPGDTSLFLCNSAGLSVSIQWNPLSSVQVYNSYQPIQFQFPDGSFWNWQADGGDFQGSYGGISIYSIYGTPVGQNRMRAIVPDALGCLDTTNYITMTIGGPAPGFVVVSDDQCYTQPVVLRDTTRNNPGDPIVSWLWNFGDGSSSTQAGTVSHIYSAPGAYTVSLTVKDSAGCMVTSPTFVQPVTMNGPEAAFTVPQGTVLSQGTTVQFNNTSNVYGTTNVTWLWNFGDGVTSTVFDPTHVYPNVGTYVVTLTATDAGGGCVSVATVTMAIQNFNTAFGKNALYVTAGNCPPVLVRFNSLATEFVSVSWDFGDGNSVSGVTNPSHVYAQPGKYLVTFTVLGLNGQTVVTVDSVNVLAPSAQLTAAVPAICVGQADTLKSGKNSGVKQYSWDFGDGYVGAGSDSAASHVYSTAGVYTAKLVMTDSLGCSVAAAAVDVINVHAPPEVALTPPRALVCLGSSVTLTATLSGGASFLWSPPTGLDDVRSSAPLATPVVSTVYTVMVTDAIGCTNSGSIPVTVVRPEPLKLVPDSAAICPGAAVQLNASGADNYLWIGDGLNSTTIGNPVARPGLSTVYKVVGSDSAGCFADTLMAEVIVLVAPAVSAGPDLTVQAETPVTIAAVGSSDVVAWDWVPATFLSCADCGQPVCVPRQTQQYIVTVTAADGCTAGDTVVVKLSCDAAKLRIPDAFTPNGDGHNDRWTILGGISEVDHLVIFDRWGARVFGEDHFFPADPGSGWDGMVGGRPAPAGVYAYFVEMHCPTGGEFSRKGTVVLVR